LELLGKTGERVVHELRLPRMMLGRCGDIEIVMPAVSRRHFELTRLSMGRHMCKDLGSRNGTLVNGERLNGKGQLLNDGDIVQAGEARFVYYSEVAD
jgi:pSer/pThr/pTyr-binding forkhead associated (FHA) protein